MSITYEQLFHLDVDALREAANSWNEMADKLKGLDQSLDTEVAQPFKRAGWSSADGTSERAAAEIKKANQGFTDATAEAKAIKGILEDAHRALKRCRDDLHHLAGPEAESQELVVSSTGEVSPRDDLSQNYAVHHDPDGQELIRQQQDKCDALARKLSAVLDRAAEADATATWGLRRDAGSKGSDFNNRGLVATLDTADAAHAVQLAKKGDKLSNAELKQLDQLLRRNKNDKAFAEAFATGLGPKGTLEFWSELSDPSDFQLSGDRNHRGLTDEQRQRMKELGSLQSDLGLTLASATQSKTSAMEDWKHSMVALGGHRTGDGTGPYGFQVMSNLMRKGEYDTAFLEDYGKALVKFEKDNTHALPTNARGTAMDGSLPWDIRNDDTRLNFGTANDAGTDPMTGFMEALGHNPDASTDFFESKSNFNYLTHDRDWQEDFAYSDAKNIAGYNSLGHALESATMGVAYDDPSSALHRDVHTGNVMEQVVKQYGDHPDLMHKEVGISDSLGRMGAAYVDDIDWAFDSNDTTATYFDSQGRATDERAVFGQSGALKFLSTLGQDPDAYSSVAVAQQAYTTTVMDQNPPTLDAQGNIHASGAEAATRVGATVQGALDQSRADQVAADGQQADQKYNDAMDKRSSWLKTGTGIAVGAGAALIPGGQGAAAVIVPIAAGAGGTAVTQQISDNIDKFTGEQHRDSSAATQVDRQDVWRRGQTSSWAPAENLARSLHDKGWSKGHYMELRQQLWSAQNTGYSFGSDSENLGGNLPTTD